MNHSQQHELIPEITILTCCYDRVHVHLLRTREHELNIFVVLLGNHIQPTSVHCTRKQVLIAFLAPQIDR